MNEEAKPKTRSPSSEKRLRKMVRDCVLEMICDRDIKPSDRLSAVKTLMEYFMDKEGADSRTIRIVLDDVPDGFAD